MRVAVLCGGESSERDVSRSSGWAVAQALAGRGHDVVLIDPAAEQPILADPLPAGDAVVRVPKEPPSPADRAVLRRRMYDALTGGLVQLRSADRVFIALHGGWGEDGHVQALLELAGIPFTGAGHDVCAVAWHKDRCQAVLEAAGIPVPARVLYNPAEQPEPPIGVKQLLASGPVVVKPVADGSSVAVRKVDSLDALPTEGELLVEPFLSGREFTVAVIGATALPVVEIELTTAVFDYEAKYQPGAVREVSPADIPGHFAERLQELAIRAHRALGFGPAYSRVDFRCDAAGTPYCLEVNALPGLTPGSLVPVAAKGAGITYGELVEQLLTAKKA
ncbi:D-alanine-D-alanine ligase [Kribbella sp. VKM Ac-2571]|uniref:D-alanine--D-alanine ligase family protein n=1 Tax=Kribbella sp. VKM Ac-2571 TaxID=2512222 RepID=UPI00105D2CAF|nr:ATP-grasp domain-containing protein [Kribbella sp. VKM Ac-2571]TDO63934.1 D-alanine-D-alanine ligase [Kribbella sp. VKM Ac-2571]